MFLLSEKIWKFIFDKIEFSNGGQLEINKTITKFYNTCSIDPFILAIYICVQFGHQIKDRSNDIASSQVFYKLLLKIHQNIYENNWNKSRYDWAQFNDIQSRYEKTVCSYDFYLSIGQAFLNKVKEFQKFSFTFGCSDKRCVKNSTEVNVQSDYFCFK